MANEIFSETWTTLIRTLNAGYELDVNEHTVLTIFVP
jgi:hypothetical protein